MVSITEDEYKELKRESMLLHFLKWGGVDNWEGWDDAIERLNEWEEE